MPSFLVTARRNPLGKNHATVQKESQVRLPWMASFIRLRQQELHSASCVALELVFGSTMILVVQAPPPAINLQGITQYMPWYGRVFSN